MDVRYKAAVFDMDGTILDTVQDLTDSLNHALREAGVPAAHTPQETRLFFGSGIRTAIRRAAASDGVPCSDAFTEKVRSYFLPYYTAHCTDKTQPYPGICGMLADLRAAGIRTAVVSNKPDAAARKLADRYFAGLFDYTAGEKTGVPVKPAPDMILEALRAMDVSGKETVYVGDSEVDLCAAKNAELDCISADWGFRTRETLEQNGARIIVSRAEEISDLLCGTQGGKI
jgi:phosphoglycolate phosphatase